VLGGIRERKGRRKLVSKRGALEVIEFQIRWLTHTGREVSPSGLKSKQPDLYGRSTTEARISTGDPLPK
jgi:hypothetical protein